MQDQPNVDHFLFSVLAPEVLAGRCPRPCNECTKTQIKRVMAELSQRFPRRFQEMMRQLAPQRGWPALLVLYSNILITNLWEAFNSETLYWHVTLVTISDNNQAYSLFMLFYSTGHFYLSFTWFKVTTRLHSIGSEDLYKTLKKLRLSVRVYNPLVEAFHPKDNVIFNFQLGPPIIEHHVYWNSLFGTRLIKQNVESCFYSSAEFPSFAAFVAQHKRSHRLISRPEEEAEVNKMT